MSGPSLRVEKFKLLFFDRVGIESQVDAETLRAQRRFAAIVRVRAQRSMRRRKSGHSAPGQPPFAKSGELRSLLFFGYDPATKTTVIGPAAFGKRPGLVPALHEFGGTLTGQTMDAWVAFGRLDQPTRSRILIEATRLKMRARDYVRAYVLAEIQAAQTEARRPHPYPRRPYMRPALEGAVSQYPELFRDTVK
jgi:hypothetical protein